MTQIDSTSALSILWDEGADGWKVLRPSAQGSFIDIYGPVRFRAEGEARVRSRLDTEPRHGNTRNALHGGFIFAYIDLLMSVAPGLLGHYGHGGAVSMQASVNFLAPGILGDPLDAVVELISDKGKTVFVQGLVEQGPRRVASFQGIMRKLAAAAKPMAP